MASSSGVKTVIIESREGVIFEVEECIACQCELIRKNIGFCGDTPFRSRLNSKELEKAIAYCKKHAEANDGDAEDLKKWDAEFVNVDYKGLRHLLIAAHALGIKSLEGLTLQKYRDMRDEGTLDVMMGEMTVKGEDLPGPSGCKEEDRKEREDLPGTSG